MGRKILVVGSTNMDIVINTPRLPLAGESAFGTSKQFLPGGKGANQAVALSRLGGEVLFSTEIGKDTFGDQLHEAIRTDGIDTSAVFISKQEPTGVAFIIVEENGYNRIIVLPGANMDYGDKEIQNIKESIKASAAVLLQLEIPIESVRKIIDIAWEFGVPVVIDAGPAQKVPLDMFKGVTILSPNETEAYALTGITITDLKSAKDACGMLLASGAHTVVIKLGEKGALIGDKKGYRHCPAYSIDAVDTTSAGDSFTAAMLLKYTRGFSIDESVVFANAVGALTASKHGSQISLPYMAEVEEFILKNKAQERIRWI